MFNYKRMGTQGFLLVRNSLAYEFDFAGRLVKTRKSEPVIDLIGSFPCSAISVLSQSDSFDCVLSIFSDNNFRSYRCELKASLVKLYLHNACKDIACCLTSSLCVDNTSLTDTVFIFASSISLDGLVTKLISAGLTNLELIQKGGTSSAGNS